MSKTIKNLMHIGLRVKNYEKSLEFYCGALGFEKMFEFTKKDFYEMLGKEGETQKPSEVDNDAIWLAYLRIKNEQYIELFPVPKEEVSEYRENQSFFHFSLQVDDIVEAVRKLRENGVAVYCLHNDIYENKPAPPVFVPLRGKCGLLIAWTQDPDGNFIELMELTEQSLQKKYDKILSKPKTKTKR